MAEGINDFGTVNQCQTEAAHTRSVMVWGICSYMLSLPVYSTWIAHCERKHETNGRISAQRLRYHQRMDGVINDLRVAGLRDLQSREVGGRSITSPGPSVDRSTLPVSPQWLSNTAAIWHGSSNKQLPLQTFPSSFSFSVFLTAKTPCAGILLTSRNDHSN